MIQIESPIDLDLALPLEDYFCELETSHWSIVQKTDNDAYRLFGYFETHDKATESWAYLRESFPRISENPQIKTIDDEDWKSAYKKYLKPWNYNDLHWVPVWEKENYTVPEKNVAVFFDAGMAFGTGAHETTQLCAQRLIDYRDTHKDSLSSLKVIDAGCGSGILAISARLLNFGSVMGFDIDEEAVRISQENAEFNGIHKHLTFKTAGLDDIFPNTKADLILANILANVLCQYSDALLNAINPQGTLVLSGILLEEVEKVKDHFCKQSELLWGNYQIDSRILGEWADLCFNRL